MHGYCHADRGGDRLLRGHPQDKAALDACRESRTSPRPRREVLPFGALVLERLLKRLKPRRYISPCSAFAKVCSSACCRRANVGSDPLLSFCADYAQLRSRSAEHAAELCTWTDALFEAPGPKETEEERRLRHAACLLSDISWRAHPDYRGEQSLNLIAHTALGGIDHPGRVFLALSIYFRHIGTAADAETPTARLSDRLKALVSKKQYRRARIIGAAIRAAHMLSIGRPGIIDETTLSHERDRSVLTLPNPMLPSMASACGGASPCWRAYWNATPRCAWRHCRQAIAGPGQPHSTGSPLTAPSRL